MKKSSAPLDIGLWAVGVLAGLYLLGFGLIWIDYEVTRTLWFDGLPLRVKMIISYAYLPLVTLLRYVGLLP